MGRGFACLTPINVNRVGLTNPYPRWNTDVPTAAPFAEVKAEQLT